MNKYKKLKDLGEGGFGKVGKYSDIKTNEVYAIKEIPLKKEDQKEIEKTENEAKLLKQINSLFVIKCYDYFIENSSLYIVLQYCPSGSLKDLLEEEKKKGSRIKEEMIWEIFIKLCLGLASFHTNKIIHRDLKPENIFMFDKGLPKIGDLGLSKALASQRFSNKNTSTYAGTPLYQSPELLDLKPASTKSDIWALGVILYELSTFSLPFLSISKICTYEKPKPINNIYSKDLENMIFEMIKKEKEDRPEIYDILSKEFIVRKLIDLNLFETAAQLYPELPRNPKIKSYIVQNFLVNPNDNSFKSLRLKIIRDDILCLCLLKDGRLVSGGKRKLLVYYTKEDKLKSERIVDKENPKEENSIINVFAVCALRNGGLASSHYADIIIWEIKKNDYKIKKKVSHDGKVNKIIETADGRLASCSDDQTIKIWDNNYNCIKTIKEHTNSVQGIIEMIDCIVSAAIDESVKIWDKSDYKCRKTIDGVYCCSPNSISKLNNNKIIIGGDKEVFIIDVKALTSQHFKSYQFGWPTSIYVVEEDKVLIANNSGNIIFYNSSSNKIIFTQSQNTSQKDSQNASQTNAYITCMVENRESQIVTAIYEPKLPEKEAS